MADNIVFNDFDVTVEIYDSVIAKWVLTDYAETDPSSTAYLRNRDLIQQKLTAGTNVTIDKDNVISAEVRLDQMEQFISKDLQNELKLGTDQLLYVGFSGLLRNGGDVATREELPDTSDPFIAHMIKDENLIVFAYHDESLGLVWLPLSFYVDMNLYVSKEELIPELKKKVDTALLDTDAVSNTVPLRDAAGRFKVADGSEAGDVINLGQLNAHNDSQESHPSILNSLEQTNKDLAVVKSDLESTDGKVDANATDIENLSGRVKTNEDNIGALGGRMTTVETNITSLDGRMTTAEADLLTKATITALNDEVARAKAEEALKLDKTSINENYITNAVFSVDGNGVQTLSVTLKNPVTGAVSTLSRNITLASQTNDGFMAKQDKITLADIVLRVGKLEGQHARYLYTESANPTAEQINAFAVSLGFQPPFTGVSIVVSATNHVWNYYQGGTGWRDDGFDIVVQATLELLGLVKSSLEDGKSYVEADGTMSINGWDTVKSDIANLADKVDSVVLSAGTNNGTLKLSVTTGSGTSSVDNIPVKGLGSAAFQNSDAFAPAEQGTQNTADITSLKSRVTTAETDISTLKSQKANIASPAFTGTPTAPTASTATNNTQIATTAFVQSVVPTLRPYGTVLPKMNGTAAVGTSSGLAREDHVHPFDTACVPTTRKINGLDLTADRNLTYANVGAASTVHSSPAADTYGGGTSSAYGHVKLSDSVALDSGADLSVGASAKAVKTVNDAVVREVSDREAAVTQSVADSKAYTDQEVKKVSDGLSSATEARDLAAGFATFDPTLLSGVSAQAIGNSQLLITFTPVVDITPDGTPYTFFSDAEASIIPTLKLRFGQVWDYAKVEQVGFCVFDQDGDLTINAVATLFAGTQYTLLV